MELPQEPPREAARQADGSYVLELEDGSSCRWTRRPDGSWRKPERKRAGWVGDLERKKYVSPGQVQADVVRQEYGRTRSAIPGLPPGYAEETQAAKSNKNERRKEVRREKADAREAERHAAAPSINEPQTGAAPCSTREYAGGADAGEPAPRVQNPKALEKKLRQVAELEERQAKGETLNADQLAKLECKTELEAELARLRISDACDVPVPAAAPAAAAAAAPAPAAEPAAAAAPAAAEAAAKAPSRKAIEKKLRQIAELEESMARGTALNADQQAKLDAKADLQAALATAE